MKSKAKTKVLWGILLALILFLGFRPLINGILQHGCFPLGIEPRYAGKSLSYWCRHAFHYHGAKQVPNADAVEALQAMKTGAFPFLVKWIATINHSSQGTDYESLALRGFQILGTNASPAIPGLIKVIGRNNNWPSHALWYVGPVAVPALIESLATNQNPDFHGNWRKGTEDDNARENVIGTLGYFGTNAEAALPLMLKCYKDEDTRSFADMSSALSSIGHKHPEVVIPALIYLLTNSSRMSKYSAPGALASFGSAAKPAIPELLAVSETADAQFKAEIGIAVFKIDPERRDALSPLVANLCSDDTGLRERALFDIERLNNISPVILEVMRQRAISEPNPDWRARIIDWLAGRETNEVELASIISCNLTNESSLVAEAAIGCLAKLADKSQTRFDELLRLYGTSGDEGVKEAVRTTVYQITRKHAEYLITSLKSPEADLSYAALQFMHSLSRDVLVHFKYEPGVATNEEWFVMKDMGDDNKDLFQAAIPILAAKLCDEKLETRKLSTNVLLELNPKAAQQAGVLVKMPYLYYAN